MCDGHTDIFLVLQYSIEVKDGYKISEYFNTDDVEDGITV